MTRGSTWLVNGWSGTAASLAQTGANPGFWLCLTLCSELYTVQCTVMRSGVWIPAECFDESLNFEFYPFLAAQLPCSGAMPLCLLHADSGEKTKEAFLWFLLFFFIYCLVAAAERTLSLTQFHKRRVRFHSSRFRAKRIDELLELATSPSLSLLGPFPPFLAFQAPTCWQMPPRHFMRPSLFFVFVLKS